MIKNLFEILSTAEEEARVVDGVVDEGGLVPGDVHLGGGVRRSEQGQFSSYKHLSGMSSSVELKAGGEGSLRWQVCNSIGNCKAGNSQTLAWQLLVPGVDLVLVVRVHGDGHEHVLLHQVGQHPKVQALVPPDQREELSIVDTSSIQLVGKWTQLNNAHWKVFTGVRPRGPGGSPMGEHFMEKAGVFCWLPA